MSATSSRFSGKTYSRPARETYTSKAFDDIVKSKDNKAPMAKSTYQRWGHSSYTSARGAGQAENVPADPKRRREENLDDPFSFDSEDDLSPRKKAAVTNVRKAVTGYGDSSGSTKQQVVIADDDDAEFCTSRFKQAPVKSYSRVPNKNGTKSSTVSVPSSNRSFSRSIGKNSNIIDKHQLPIDIFTTKSKVERLTEKPIPVASAAKSLGEQRKTYTRKFFQSKNVGLSSKTQHDTSNVKSYSESVVTDTSQTTRTTDSSIWDSDDNSDISIPESGDPEIIFTPRKKRQDESPYKTDSSVIHEIDDTDTPPSSPLTELREATSRDHSYYIRLNEESTADAGTAASMMTSSDSMDFDDHNYFSRKTNMTAVEKDNDSSSNSSFQSVDRRERKLDGKRANSLQTEKLSQLTKDRSLGKKLEGPVIRKILTSPKKDNVKAVYNPRSWHMSPPAAGEVSKKKDSTSIGIFDDLDEFDDDFDKKPLVLKKVSTWPLRREHQDNVSIKVNKESKGLFTVVRNVKQAHECQEHGETQEFQDDIEYLLDGLEDSQSLSVRCLSTINVATKCKQPSFRMHLRAHGTLSKIFSALHDASDFPTLALCTSAVMYMMSRDRLNMDMDVKTLHLMIKLLSVDPQFGSTTDDRALLAEYERLQEKVHQLCEQLDSDTNGTPTHFDLDSVSSGTLAMETLLSLTSRRAGDWFKEEVRELKGLDHISDTINSCICDMNADEFDISESNLDVIRKVDRCLRVLEHVTYLNIDNQNYLIAYKSSSLVKSMVKTLKLVQVNLAFNPVEENPDDQSINKDSPGYIMFTSLLADLSVLLNLTHDNEYGSIRIGQQADLIPCTLTCVLQIPQYVPVDKRFDLYVLGLGLLINLVEHCDMNRSTLTETYTQMAFECADEEEEEEVVSLQALVKMFLHWEESARRMEDEEFDEKEEKEDNNADNKDTVSQGSNRSGQDQDQSGMWKESESGLEWVVIPVEKEEDSDVELDVEFPNAQDEEDETFTKALHKAGKHMEGSIVASYLALLIGCVIQDTTNYIEEVRRHLPDGDFSPLVKMLKKFLGFMNLTSGVGNTGGKSIARVIEILEAC